MATPKGKPSPERGVGTKKQRAAADRELKREMTGIQRKGAVRNAAAVKKKQTTFKSGGKTNL